MKYEVVITEAAWSDLLEIARRIKLDNPRRSESFVSELYDRCISLRNFPESHARMPDVKRRGVRRVVHGDYLSFFRVMGATVEVIHIVNGAMDYMRLLFPEDER